MRSLSWEKWANTGSGISVSEVNMLHLQITRSVQTGRVFCWLSVKAAGFERKQFKTNRYEKHIKIHAMAKAGHAPVRPLALVYRGKGY